VNPGVGNFQLPRLGKFGLPLTRNPKTDERRAVTQRPSAALPDVSVWLRIVSPPDRPKVAIRFLTECRDVRPDSAPHAADRSTFRGVPLEPREAQRGIVWIEPSIVAAFSTTR
jgi:hypothetical protein